MDIQIESHLKTDNCLFYKLNCFILKQEWTIKESPLGRTRKKAMQFFLHNLFQIFIFCGVYKNHNQLVFYTFERTLRDLSALQNQPILEQNT